MKIIEVAKMAGFREDCSFGMKPVALQLLALVFGLAVTAHSHSLEESWKFAPDPSGTLTIGDLAQIQTWRVVRIGLSWQAQFEDLRDYQGAAWYRPWSRKTSAWPEGSECYFALVPSIWF
jgi:hypothetical protein